MISKNKFIKYVKNEKVEDELTYEDCVKALKKKTLGADGVSIALTILWLQEDMKDECRRNRRSDRKLIKWLKSEMRWYADYGSLNPIVGRVVNEYFECLRDRRKHEREEAKKDEYISDIAKNLKGAA